MHAILAKDHLFETVSLAGSIVNQRTTNPLTQNVMLEATKDSITVSATDLELSLTRTLGEVDVKTPGKVLLNAQILTGLLKDIRSETVELKQDGNNVALTAGRDHFTLTSPDPEDFPKVPDSSGDAEITISGAVFNNAIRKCGRHVAQEKGRYALNGVLFEPSDKHVEFCGTDGRRLAFFRGNASGKSVDYQIIMPIRAYGLLTKVIGTGDPEVKLNLSENRITANVADVSVTGMLVEGQFPDYRSVIPGDLDKSFTVDLNELRLALTKAKVLTSVESQAVKLEVKPGELTIRSKSPAAGQAEIAVDIEYDGDETTLGFDPQYILQGLDGFDEEKVVFDFKDRDTGAILHTGDKETFYFLVMPIDV